MAKIIIIGGGVAGLSAGIYARLSGHTAVIYEKHTEAGGNLTGWQRGPYHIDNCIHWLTGTSAKTKTYKMWKTLGVLDNGVYCPPSLYTCELDGRRLSLYRDIRQLEDELMNVSPADKKQIRSLMAAVRAAAYICGLCEDGKADLPKLFGCYKMTAGELADKFSHPLIKMFLSSFLTEDFGSLGLIFVFASFCYGNADLPRGGSKDAARKMISKFKSLGGELHTGVGAERLLFDGKTAVSVLLSDGTEAFADYFILTADPCELYKKLTGKQMPRALCKMKKNGKLRLFSSVHCAFACPDVLDFDGDLVLEMTKDAQILSGAKYLTLRNFSHESSCAPEGETVLQALFFCREERCRQMIDLFENKEAYKKIKDLTAECVREQIEKKYPDLSGKLKLLDVWTPATYKRFTGSGCGTYMSYAFSSEYVPRPCKNKADGYKNVYLATQWLLPPGGLPTAANAGKNAVVCINRAEKQAGKSKRLP